MLGGAAEGFTVARHYLESRGCRIYGGASEMEGKGGRRVPAEGEVVIWGGTLRPVPPPCRAGARSVVVDRSS